MNLFKIKFLVCLVIVFLCGTQASYIYCMLQFTGQYAQALASNATLIHPYELTTQTYTINTPGIYLLVSDIVFTPTFPQPAFHIAASGVQLDFNKRLLAQYTPTLDCIGVEVDANLSGIQIKNGSVFGLTGTGIVLHEGNGFFSISDLNFHGCHHCIVDLAGTDALSPITSGVIQNLSVTQCATNTVVQSVINGEYLESIKLQNIIINQCGDTTDSLSAFNIVNSSNCQILNSNIIGCDSLSNFVGYFISSGTNIIIDQSNIVNNASNVASSECCAIRIKNTTATSTFSECVILDNGNANADFIGIDVQDDCSDNIFSEMRILQNDGKNCTGISFSSTESPTTIVNTIVNESYIAGNRAHSGNFVGIELDATDTGIIRNTRIAQNDSLSGVAAGILFTSGKGGSFWQVTNCEIGNNTGNSDTDSYGINVMTGHKNSFIKNIVIQNGCIPANQLSGVPAGSVSLVSSANINSVSAPWTNIGITS